MNIGMVTSSYPRFEGDIAGTFIRSLAEAVASLGHSVHVIAPWDPKLEEVPGNARVHWVRYAPFDSWYLVGYGKSLDGDVALRRAVYPLVPLYAAAATAALWRCHLQEHFDVIHAHWAIPGGAVGAAASVLTGAPLVVSLHGSDVYMLEQNAVARRAAQWAFARAQKVTGCSLDLLRRAARARLPEAKALPLHYGVDTGSFRPDARAGRILRQELGIGERAPVVLALGRLVYKKGFEYLVRATPAIAAAVPNVRVVIAGEGPLRPSLEDLTAELGINDHVVLVGNVPWTETPRYFNMSDVFVVPSVRDQEGNLDGLPNVLLEAMSCGRPVVATRVAGIPEVIVDRYNGRLVDEKDPEQLAAAIVELLTSPALAASCAAATCQTIENRLTWRQIALSTIEVYEQAIAACS